MENKNKLKIIFLGSPDFAIPALQTLLQDGRFLILAAITQPDKPAGRGQELSPPPVKKFALENNLPVWQPEKIKDLKEKISEAAPDFLIAVAYGKLIPKSVLDIPKYGCINIHGSILPRYRGAAVIQAPILNGDEEAGITIMLMDEGLDTGPILKIAKIKLSGAETAQGLHDALAKLGAETLPPVLIALSEEKIRPQAQAGESIYVKEIKKEDGRIDWRKPAAEIERMVRAYTPWPSTFSTVPLLSDRVSPKALAVAQERLGEVGEKIHTKLIKILEAENNILPINKFKIGEIFLTDKKLAVQCGAGALIIKKLQLEGGKPLSADEFLRGRADFIGTILK